MARVIRGEMTCCLTGKCYPVNEPRRRFVASH
jgi:hypothetical protein